MRGACCPLIHPAQLRVPSFSLHPQVIVVLPLQSSGNVHQDNCFSAKVPVHHQMQKHAGGTHVRVGGVDFLLGHPLVGILLLRGRMFLNLFVLAIGLTGPVIVCLGLEGQQEQT